jgi:glycosyltransferase involved in cell wall biosynthesis
MTSLSIVIPAKNEVAAVGALLEDLRAHYPDAELILVDDGSDDGTGELAAEKGARVVRNTYSKGNGAAIKTGAREATGDILVFMDGDGQHSPSDIGPLLDKLEQGYDMVVGAREGVESQAGFMRWGANSLYNALSSWMVGQDIKDLTSGMRVARRSKFVQFLYLLPNGFSYPTTSTMAFFRAGYSVGLVPITVSKRIGTSHVKVMRDGLRFFLIIFKIGTLYSPLKIFFPIAALMGGLGLLNYVITYVTEGRFTNMSTLLMLAAVTVFLIGLVSEQITNLMYQNTG